MSTHVSGSGRWANVDAGVVKGELSARATNRGITANVIHAFDASMCHAVVQRMAQKGQQGDLKSRLLRDGAQFCPLIAHAVAQRTA